MKSLKFSAFTLLMIFSLFIISCSKENEAKTAAEENTQQNSQQNDYINKGNAKVFPATAGQRAVGKKAPDFSWKQDGKEVKFSEFTKDKYVLLNFWGTWCPPCRRELPDLVAISKEMESKGVQVIGIALERTQDMNEALQLVSEFWQKEALHYPVIIGIGDIVNAYGGINAVPTTFLINKKGDIVTSFEGSRSKEGFMEEINKMMN